MVAVVLVTRGPKESGDRGFDEWTPRTWYSIGTAFQYAFISMGVFDYFSQHFLFVVSCCFLLLRVFYFIYIAFLFFWLGFLVVVGVYIVAFFFVFSILLRLSPTSSIHVFFFSFLFSNFPFTFIQFICICFPFCCVNRSLPSFVGQNCKIKSLKYSSASFCARSFRFARSCPKF